MSDTQERSHGQGKVGRMALDKDVCVDLKMTAHTLDNAAKDLASIPSGLGRYEWERMRNDLVSRIELAMRTVEGAARRGGK